MNRIVFAIGLVYVMGITFPAQSAESPWFSNEEITYAIRQYGIPMGEATLRFVGKTELNGQNVFLITFAARGFNFLDEEKIYVSPQTYLPLRVERNLNIFGRRETIIEDYDIQNGEVTVTKSVGDKTTVQKITKESHLDNIYCFIYRYRQKGTFKVGDTFDISLPTKDIVMRLIKSMKLGAAGKRFNAYLLQSDPRKYKVWFDSGPAKIPLRIDGALGFTKTSMIMKSYHQEKEGEYLASVNEALPSKAISVKEK